MYKCNFLGKNDVTDDMLRNSSKKLMEKDNDEFLSQCSSFHSDCGVPILSSLPILNNLFPRVCVTNREVVELAIEKQLIQPVLENPSKENSVKVYAVS
jgi:hypothetical protein